MGRWQHHELGKSASFVVPLALGDRSFSPWQVIHGWHWQLLALRPRKWLIGPVGVNHFPPRYWGVEFIAAAGTSDVHGHAVHTVPRAPSP